MHPIGIFLYDITPTLGKRVCKREQNTLHGVRSLRDCEVTAASSDTDGWSRAVFRDCNGLQRWEHRICAAHTARRPRPALQMWQVQLRNSILTLILITLTNHVLRGLPLEVNAISNPDVPSHKRQLRCAGRTVREAAGGDCCAERLSLGLPRPRAHPGGWRGRVPGEEPSLRPREPAVDPPARGWRRPPQH